jgi:hypothetical protein
MLAGVGPDWVPLVWFAALWIGLISILLGLFQWNRKRLEQPRSPTESTNTFERKSKSGVKKTTGEVAKKMGESKPPPTTHKKIEAVVTEKTREEMFEMISQVKSLTQEISRPKLEDVDMSDEEIRKLNESGVVKGLIETLMSDVQTDEVQGQKFSKMTLDASLFFDESDVDFFEKEFGQEKKK